MNLLNAGWRSLQDLPPLLAWRLLHSLPEILLDRIAWASGRPKPPQGLGLEFLGYRLEHPVGIAAGLDKDASLLWVAWSMGAGFHVVGSVLPHPYKGVEPKILARLPGGGTVNRLGLPSRGPGPVEERLRIHRPPGMPVAVSIAAFTVEGYGEVYRRLGPLAAWVEVNISCPNVEDHRSFEDPGYLPSICGVLRPRSSPLLLKIPPTRDDVLLKQYLRGAVDCGFKGIVAGNTRRVTYRGVNAGLGGPSLFDTTLYMVRRLRSMAPGEFKIIGVGGVDSGRSARLLLEAGADLVEVMSAVIHRGPLAPWLIASELGELV